MAVKKTVQIEFANTAYSAVSCMTDLKDAVQSAAPNLLSKYQVGLGIPRVINGYQVVTDLTIPEEIAEDFSIGNHLRGLSAYLLKYCDGRYDAAVMGKRLLNYVVLPEEGDSTQDYSLADRLSMVAAFAELLKNNDSVSNEKISRIMAILGE